MLLFWGKDLLFFYNNAFRASLGNDGKHPAVGKRGEEVWAEIWADVKPLIDQVLNTGEPTWSEDQLLPIYRNGQIEEVYWTFSYSAVRDADGRPEGVFVTCSETTEKVTSLALLAEVNANEQVKSRREIAEVNERLHIALEAGSLGYTEVDLATGTMQCNEQFKKCYGRAADEGFTYSDLFEAMLPEYREEIKEKVAIAKADGSLYKAIYEVKWPDGSVHWINAHGRPRYDRFGNADRMVGIVLDVTEQKQDEQRKNDFIGMVSHELKTPLTSLNASLQMVQRGISGREKPFSGLLDKSINQVRKMTTMINGFLNVSRLESGKIHINKQDFDLAVLIREAEDEIVPMYPSHHFIFHPVEPTIVSADKEKISHVINNLITNAIKYSSPGSTIEIACITKAGAGQFSVKDEGIGISAEDMQQLFDRYYRVPGNPNVSGFGIGLYLSCEIIKRHQGRIWANSEVGKGSTFCFSLPVKTIGER